MLHVINHNKAGRNFNEGEVHWRSLFKTSEDSLTSSIFERLAYLPDEMSWKILKDACYGNDLPKVAGPLLSIEYWPHWNSENTVNSNFVEPDVFLRYPGFDLLIEAKRFDDNQQNQFQWKKELESYTNEYLGEKKAIYFIALGGIKNEETEYLNNFPTVPIIKCRWMSLLQEIIQLQNIFENTVLQPLQSTANLRILNDLILAFQLHGFSTGLWLESLQNIQIDYFD